MKCVHVPQCPTCASFLLRGADKAKPLGPSLYTDLPWITHYRSDAARNENTSTPENTVVVSVDNVRSSREQAGKLEVAGKRFHRLSLQQISQYYEKRHTYDRHLYESLRSGVPYKPVFDLDREIDERSPPLAVLQAAYTEIFIPFLLGFFSKVLGVPVTQEQVASLDASLEQKKFSKHITLHVLNPTDNRILAYATRQDEMAVMRSFREAVETQAEKCARMGGFYYFISNGNVRTIVDYAIYHNGKRDMRMVGSCKANGKSLTKPLRTLMPETDLAMRAPFCVFVCNVFGDNFEPIRPTSTSSCSHKAPRRQSGKRKRQTTALAPSDDVLDEKGVLAFGSLIPGLRVIAQEAGGHVGGVRCREDRNGGVQLSVSANFQADPSRVCDCQAGVCTCRRCLFGVPHSRHWAEIRCNPTSCKQLPSRITYYCHGCLHSTDLYNSEGVAISSAVANHCVADDEYLRGPDIAYTRISSRYLPPISIVADVCTGKGTLILKSGMGSGKTTQIRKYIASLPPGKSILCIGYRRVLNSALAANFGLVDYQQTTRAELPQCRRVCVQVDSLPRLLADNGSSLDKVLRHSFDVVIVDEAESTMNHFAASTLAKKVLLCWKVFALLVHNAQTLIMADADAGSRTMAVVRGMRPSTSSSRPQLIENIDPANGLDMCTSFIWMPSLDAFLQKALDILCRIRKPIYLATNSKGFAHSFMAMVLSHASRYDAEQGCPLSRDDVLLIDRDVPEETKRRVKECNEIWIRYKLVICTPTVGAGIDFSVKGHFHSTFVYATDRSTTPREINQQRGRVRFPADKRCYMLVDTHHNPVASEHPNDALRIMQRCGAAVIDDLMEIECQSSESSEWMGVRLSITPELLLRLAAIHMAEVNASRNNMRVVLYWQLRRKFPGAEHVLLSGPLTGPADARMHAVGMAIRRAQAAALVLQPVLDDTEVRRLTTAVITGDDEQYPTAKQQLHMQMLRDFFPGRVLAAGDVMTIGHASYLARVEFATTLLTPVTDIKRLFASAEEWQPVTVTGAAQFSIAHRTSLESTEPAHVTQVFFALFAFYAGIVNAHHPIKGPGQTADICGIFFDKDTVFHSSVSESRTRMYPSGFATLQRKFGEFLGTPEQVRRMVRKSFRRRLASDMGIGLPYAKTHKHYEQDGETLGESTTDCCSTAVVDRGDALGLLDCVRAHKPSEVSGIRAGQYALRLAGMAVSAIGPVICEVRGVGMGPPPVRVRKEIPTSSTSLSGSRVLEAAISEAVAKLQSIRRALSE
jgi:hypothetical protein